MAKIIKKKPTVKKMQGGGVTNPTKKKVPETRVLSDDMSISNAARRLAKDPKDVGNVMNQLMRLNPAMQGARAIAEGIYGVGAALGNKGMQKENATRDSTYNAQKKELQKNKKGGVIKKKMGGVIKKTTKPIAKKIVKSIKKK